MTGFSERRRRCVGCGAERPKREMIRVARSPDGSVVIDETGRAQGRGAYLCRDAECLRAAMKKKALARALRSQVGREVYEMIEPLCGGGGDGGVS